LVGEIRPELHRYCARLIGSVIDGEDIVQETLARAFYALAGEAETPNLRPWLFRIAHNAAIDVLKSHGHKLTDSRGDIIEVVDARAEAPADPAITRAAVARFLVLPLRERSAVILKDVLGHSLEETAETMGTSVLAVKAALARGRGKLREHEDQERADSRANRSERTVSRIESRPGHLIESPFGEQRSRYDGNRAHALRLRGGTARLVRFDEADEPSTRDFVEFVTAFDLLAGGAVWTDGSSLRVGEPCL
jgi:RNA polymerase sigma factor (sigma-70 family)